LFVCLLSLHVFLISFVSLLRRPPRSTLFPYTTLFRSKAIQLLKIAANRFFSVFLSGQCTTLAAAGEAQDIFRQPMCSVDIRLATDRKSTRLNSSHVSISYAVFCLKKKKRKTVHNVDTV